MADPPPPRMPRVDTVRRRLGGRARSLPGTGQIVRIQHSGTSGAGVVLFVSPDELDVWLGDGRVCRVARSQTEPEAQRVSGPLSEIARAAIRFAALSEGERVQFVDRSNTCREGILVEKCRYGGLVVTEDGTVSGIGFRRIEAARTGSVC